MQVVDNLVLLHSQAEGRSRIYDLQLVSKDPAVEVNIRISFFLLHFDFLRWISTYFFRWMVQISSNHLFQPLQFADRFVDHYPVTRTTPWTGTNSFVSKRIVDTASPFPTPPLGLFFDPMSWLTHAQVISFTCHSFCNSEPLEDAGHMWRLMLRLEAAQGDPLTTAKLLLNRCLTFSGKGTLSLQRSL